MKRRFLILVFVLTFSTLAFGQLPARPLSQPVDPAKAAERIQKQNSIIDQVASDLDGLGLAENRAYAGSKLGSLLWKRDPKAASVLFQKSVDELINAQSQVEAEARNRLNRSSYENRISQSIRPAVLLLIAASDAKFALESLYRTRTSAIQRAIAQAAEPTVKIADLNSSAMMQARGELNLEQRIMRLAAEQNPETAVKMLLETLKKGMSTESLSLLKKLFEKDPESANSIAGDVLDKLNSSEFSNNPADADNLTLSAAILTDYIRDKKPDAKELKFSDSGIRSLANKLINFTLTQDPRMAYQRFASVMTIAQKLSPTMFSALQKIQKTTAPAFSSMDPDVRKIIESKNTAAQMAADAKALPPEQRAPVLQAAANKMAQTGDLTGANAFVNANFSGVALENALNTLNTNYAMFLMGQGKFADAERVVDDLPENYRRPLLMQVATAAFKKDPVENKSFAVGVLRKVRSALPDRPAENGELALLMQLATAYSTIEPDEAFNCLEPLTAQLNELADANAVVQGFQNSFGVRLGEFVIGTGNSYGFQFDMGTLRSLAKADLDRLNKLIDGLTRREIRTGIRLQLAESGL